MSKAPFSAELLCHNLEALAMVSPEVATWLEAEASGMTPPTAPRLPRPVNALSTRDAQEGGLTLILGGGLLDEVMGYVSRVPPGHQVFVLEPRAGFVFAALGRHRLADTLTQEDLVFLAPGEEALAYSLSRHPQLALSRRLELIHLHINDGDPEARKARASLYRLLGHAQLAREQALCAESHCGANLVSNLGWAALMARAPGLAGSLAGRPAVLVSRAEGLDDKLAFLKGKLGEVALFCTDKAAPAVLNAGIVPSALAITSPLEGPLFELEHPLLEGVPLLAEEVAHPATLRRHPGPVFLCLGARGTALPPYDSLAPAFTPQHHPLPRLAEAALWAGCDPLILAGTELTSPDGELTLPAMNGRETRTTREKAAVAGALGQILARKNGGLIHTSPGALAVPTARLVPLEELGPFLRGPGGPIGIPALGEEWLPPEGLLAFSQGLGRAALSVTRLWQRAAAPLRDLPREEDSQAACWLMGADALFVALAEQAAADSMMSSCLDGCLVRAFRRRRRLACQSRRRDIGLMEACRHLSSSLEEMESSAGRLAREMWEAAGLFRRLAEALEAGDKEAAGDFARRLGRTH